MNRGSKPLGEEIWLGCQCRDATGQFVAPDAAPTMHIIRASTGALVVSKSIPAHDRYGTTGLFGYRQFLGSTFSTGMYYALYSWTDGAHTGGDFDVFDVQPGGDAGGSVISMAFIDNPRADFIVGQTDGGNLVHYRNPRI